MKKYITTACIFIVSSAAALAFPADNHNSGINSLTNCQPALIAAASPTEWIERSNLDLSDGNRPGWTIQTPAKWVSIPDVSPGWPYGAGFRTPTGRTGIIVTWLERISPAEQDALKSRDYIASPITLAGIHSTIYTRRMGPSFKEIIYIERPGGFFRISAFGETTEKATLQKVIKSFAFTYSHSSQSNRSLYNDKRRGISLDYPAQMSISEQDEGFNLKNDGQTLAEFRFRKGSDSGQSFRGLARSLGKTHIEGASSLVKFEPYTVSGLTGYQAVWETQPKHYCGPIIYVPLSGSEWKVLEITLVDAKNIEKFFKIIGSLKVSSASLSANVGTESQALWR